MTVTNQGAIPDGHVTNQEYIIFCCRSNYNAPNVVDIYVYAISSTIGVVIVSAFVQVVGETANDAIAATDAAAFGATTAVVLQFLFSSDFNNTVPIRLKFLPHLDPSFTV